jgi:hypothetical protein
MVTIKHAIQNIIGFRNIYIITALNGAPSPQMAENIQIIDENIFGFDVAEILGENTRNGWYLQQLLKLYAWKYIENLAEYYLVLDADTVFLKPTEFFLDGIPMYNVTGRQNHKPYYEHMNKLHPSLKKRNENLSGITNHMMFNRHVLTELFEMVEKYHENTHPFWELFLEFVEEEHVLFAGASEYEIYFNYIYFYHNTNIIIRNLNYLEINGLTNNPAIDYVSCHSYMRTEV